MGNGQFENIYGLSLTDDGMIYVVDVADDRIQKFSSSATAVPPVADFTASPLTGTAPLTVRFIDKSENNPTSWNWNFGDGSPVNGTRRNPVHTYRESGTYTVSLNATSADGSDMMTKTGYITVTSGAADSVGVFRPASHRFLLKNGSATTTVNWGVGTDLPVTGDWNGDNLADAGVFRPATHRFLLKNGSATTTVNWGVGTDLPVAGDWNGDNLAEVGVFRQAIHKFILKNGTERTIVNWGIITDLPVTGRWR
jgi:PKD repeat protein